MRELQLAGLIERRPGSGSFVGTGPGEESGLLFGLLFPNVADTEIFGPISQGMSEAPQACLALGQSTPDPATRADQTWKLCQQYIRKNVAGVFFAPLERSAESDETNQRIIFALERVHIPVVSILRE